MKEVILHLKSGESVRQKSSVSSQHFLAQNFGLIAEAEEIEEVGVEDLEVGELKVGVEEFD
jgi:hypothetical protein